MDLSETKWAVVAILVSLLVLVYLKARRRHSYWRDRGVAHLNPYPFVGNIMSVICQKHSVGELYTLLYKTFPNDKVVGLYELTKPVLIVRDPLLLEKILVKDFQYFVDHSIPVSDDNLFSTGLFQLTGVKWRWLRYKLSPAFTSGKLKMIFNSMLDCTDEMIKSMKDNVHTDYKVKDALTTFTIDIIANTVFGIQINDIIAREEFKNQGTAIFDVTWARFIIIFIMSHLPKLSKMLKLSFLKPETAQYFRNIIKRTFDQRINGNIQRNDYLNHLIKLKEKGVIEIQSRDEDDAFLDLDSSPPPERVEITNEILSGQAFQFLTAGFDPLFNTLLFVMFDMCRFPETQKRARQEIKEVLERNGGYSYKAIKEMDYLEQCLQESLRLHTLVPFLNRVCTKNYKTDFGLEIEKGQTIVIPLNALHLDSKYYPNPQDFIPERFPPNTSKSNFTYLPFGDGPRMCIGLRFAMVELKLGLAKIIENFSFTLSAKTKLPLEFNKRAFIMFPKNDILFNVTPA